MKKVIFGTLFLGLVGLGIVGCKKADIPNKSLNEKNSIKNKEDLITYKSDFMDDEVFYEYYINGINVDEIKFKEQSVDKYTIVEGVDKKDGEPYEIVINSFTNETNYRDFVSSSKYSAILKADEFENAISDYLEEHPEVEITYETEGRLLSEYEAFQDSIYESILGPYMKAPTTIHDMYYGGSPAWVMFSPLVPAMAPGWNNRTSAIFNLNILSFINLYDKTFFRARMATFFGFHGWQLIPFIKPLDFLDNRTSSAIH